MVDLGKPVGSEQRWRRPAVVVQNDDLSRLNTRLIIVLTKNIARAKYRGNVLLPASETGLSTDSVALGYSIREIDRSRFIHIIGSLSPKKLSEVEVAILYALGVPTSE